jgi:hypothetical protein
MKHAETHPTLDIDGCFACRISGLTIGVSQRFVEEKTRESILSKDLDAYRRLRKNGTQPKTIDGSANVESRAEESWQVASGILPDKSLIVG